MLTGFYSNMGMGAKNLVAIHPPSLISDDIGMFLCFDRILVDGNSLDWLVGETAGPERWFFDALSEVGFIEAKRDFCDEKDVRRGQELFIEVHRKLRADRRDDEIPLPALGPSFEREINRIKDVRGGYYLFMKNFLAIRASEHLGCPIVDGHELDINVRLTIMEHTAPGKRARDADLLSALIPVLNALKRALEVRIPPYPICVNRSGDPAEPMAVTNQYLPHSEAAEAREWYDEHCIDIGASEKRLRTFLGLRKAEKFKAFQSYLLRTCDAVANIPPPEWMANLAEHHESALARLRLDFANRHCRPIEALDTLSPPERSAFWKAHPEHAWYGYLREDWIEAVNLEPTLTRLN